MLRLAILGLGMANLLCSIQPSLAIDGASDIGGTYRYGHIYWTANGNEVDFRLEVVFKRNVSGLSYWKGSAVDGLGQVGDEIILVGRESPQFYFGDGSIEMVPKMRVQAYSVIEDWIMGEFRKTYTYQSPSNQGMPWMARFTGCCRSSQLVNNKDVSWSISATIDLALASQSPRAHSLPVITVPQSNPKFFVPSDDNTPGVSWKVATPFEVGNAVEFDGSSYMAVSLAQHHQAFLARKCGEDGLNSGPQCLFQSLRTYAEPAAMTIEGWVWASQSDGGYVLSVSRGPGLDTTPYPATLVVRVTNTHVIVGHENEGTGGMVLNEVDFEVCSSPVLQAQPECQQGITGRWVHISVVRYMMSEGPFTLAARVKVSYKVMVNGEELETMRFGVRVREEQYALSGGEDYEAGESPIMDAPPFTATSSADSDDFASDLSLLFGAYRGGAAADGFLAGRLDEWRFWNGARSPSAIKSLMHQPLKPEKRQYYGDPSADRDLDRAARLYKVASVLMASWSFDLVCPGTDPACALPAVAAEYPADDDARVADKAAYAAVAVGAVAAGATDSTGVMFYSEAGGVLVSPTTGEVTLGTQATGLHQVLLLLTFAGGALHVPVDFMVDVTPATCSGEACAFTCDGESLPRTFPVLSVSAMAVYDPAHAGLEHKALFVADAVHPATLIADADFATVLYPGSLKTFVGFDFAATFTATKEVPSDAQAEAEALRTTMGFTVGPLRAGERMRLSAPRGQNPAEMDLRWLPCAEDAGSHTVCVDAVDRMGDGVATCLRRAASTPKCLRVQVEADPAPRFLTGEGQTPTAAIEAVMGRPVAMPVVAMDDNCMDAVTLALAGGAPAGAQLGPEELVEVTEGGQVLPCQGVKRMVEWAPAYSQGGLRGELCVTATDTGGTGHCRGEGPKTTAHCVAVTVRRCEYALVYDQELQEVAALFGADWMRLWSLNSALLHPDYVVYGSEEATLHVGHLLQVQPGETASGIAARMGMPLQQLQLLNHDLNLTDPAGLLAGAHLCVIPNSCAGLAGSAYRQQYANPDFARDAPPYTGDA